MTWTLVWQIAALLSFAGIWTVIIVTALVSRP